MKLLKHQKETIEHARRADALGHGTLLYHVMGSGKTVTALSICKTLFPDRQIVVYAPAHVKSTWETEKRLVDENLRIESVLPLESLLKVSKNTRPDAIVIVDEAHHLFELVPKNKHIYNFLRSFHRAYFLTGTPFRHNIDEIGMYINILAKKNIIPESISEFKKRFIISPTRKQLMWNNWIVRTLFASVTDMGKKYVFIKTLRRKGALKAFGSLILAFVAGELVNKLLYETKVNAPALAKSVNPYVTIVTQETIGRTNHLSFPVVVRSRPFFSYTEEQRSKLITMLSKEHGVISSNNLKNLFGEEIDPAHANATVRKYIKSISGPRSKGDPRGGPEVGRVSGWYNKSVPPKFIYISELCASRRHLVIYSNFIHIAKQLVEYLTSQGHGKRVQNMLETYPKIDVKAMQNKFFKTKDIIVLHPNMTEGISIKGASTLVITEPFSDASKKQQLEARVVRLGSHAIESNNKNKVEIITCITGIDLFSDPFEELNSIKTLVRKIIAVIRRAVVTHAKVLRNGNIVTTPPWFALDDISHLQLGPEILQERDMVNLENIVSSFVHRTISLISGKKTV